MMRSLFSAVSGLRIHQLRMDVIGNNIANVNTVGFKASRANFSELFSQTIRGASGPQNGRGGTNPAQVGLGVGLASIDQNMTAGSLQVTGVNTDLALQGEGFFVLRGGSGQTLYTRAGAFQQDADGYLVDPATGARVQGWEATNGVLPTADAQNLTDVRIPVGEQMPAQATSNMALAGNLNANTATSGQYVVTADVFDSLGNVQRITLTFTKTGADAWSWAASGTNVTSGSGNLTFNTNGTVATGGSGTVTLTPPGAANMSVTVDFSKLTQFAAPSTGALATRDGNPAGALQSFTIDTNGVITGTYSNSLTRAIAQVAVSQFTNPGGLQRAGGGMFTASNNSGIADIGAPGTSGRGSVAPGSLEMSNVDLAEQFTDMITTQRGFQANARVITTSDEMLQELANLKR